MTANEQTNDFGLSPEEAQLHNPSIKALIDRHAARGALAIWCEHAGGKINAVTVANQALTDLMVADATGSLSPSWGDAIIQQFASLGGGDLDKQVGMASQGLAFLAGLKPEDTLQAVVGAQIYALHLLAMKLASSALNSDDDIATDRLTDILKLTGQARDALVHMKGPARG